MDNPRDATAGTDRLHLQFDFERADEFDRFQGSNISPDAQTGVQFELHDGIVQLYRDTRFYVCV